MRVYLFIYLFCISSCTLKSPERKVASFSEVRTYGLVDHSKVQVRQVPKWEEDKASKHSFHLHLKDSDGRNVDFDENEIKVYSSKKKEIPFHLERITTGRYYLLIDLSQKFLKDGFNIVIQGKLLPTNFKLIDRQPDRNNSRISYLKTIENRAYFQLELFDRNGKAISGQEHPDILLEGYGMLEELRLVKPGIWEFSVLLPEETQIIYFSVYSLGVNFTNIFRYHHVEK